MNQASGGMFYNPYMMFPYGGMMPPQNQNTNGEMMDPNNQQLMGKDFILT